MFEAVDVHKCFLVLGSIDNNVGASASASARSYEEIDVVSWSLFCELLVAQTFITTLNFCIFQVLEQRK